MWSSMFLWKRTKANYKVFPVLLMNQNKNTGPSKELYIIGIQAAKRFQ